MNLRRKLEEKFFHALSAIVTLFIVLVLVHLVWTIIAKGAPSLSWKVVSTPPNGSFYFTGEGGGFLNAIAGSFYLAVSATILSFLVSLPVALFLNIYLIKAPKVLTACRFFLDVLWAFLQLCTEHLDF